MVRVAARTDYPPLLLIHDPDDPETPYATSEKVVASWPGARLMTTRGLGRLAHSLAEHDAIVQAIFRGDGEGAAALMRRHMQLVRSSVGDVSPSFAETQPQTTGVEPAPGAPRPETLKSAV